MQLRIVVCSKGSDNLYLINMPKRKFNSNDKLLAGCSSELNTIKCDETDMDETYVRKKKIYVCMSDVLRF